MTTCYLTIYAVALAVAAPFILAIGWACARKAPHPPGEAPDQPEETP